MPYLWIGDAGSAVAKDGNSGSLSRSGNISMARHCSEARCAVAADIKSVGDEVEIDEMMGRGEAKLHQWDKALSAGEKLGVFS